MHKAEESASLYPFDWAKKIRSDGNLHFRSTDIDKRIYFINKLNMISEK